MRLPSATTSARFLVLGAVSLVVVACGGSTTPADEGVATLPPSSSTSAPLPTLAPPSPTTRIAASTPTAAEAPTSAPAPAPTAASSGGGTAGSGTKVVVAHTDGQGANLHSSAGMANAIGAVAEGAELTVTGDSQDADGHTWLPVTTADGTKGWIAKEFTAPAS